MVGNTVKRKLANDYVKFFQSQGSAATPTARSTCLHRWLRGVWLDLFCQNFSEQGFALDGQVDGSVAVPEQVVAQRKRRAVP